MAQSIQVGCEEFYAERDNRTDLSYPQPQEPVLLALTIADGWSRTPAGQLTLLWLCSLVARMGRRYNRLQLWLPDDSASYPCLIPGVAAATLVEAIITHLKAADPCGAYERVTRPAAGSFVVSVGDLPEGINGLIVQPLGWTAVIASTSTHVAAGGPGLEFNPVGSALAAALGAAAVYYHFNQQLLSHYESQAPLWISALRGSTTTSAEEAATWEFGPNLPEGLDIRRILVVGAGALGGNVSAILGMLKSLRGRVEIVDDDRLEVSNLNRLVSALVHHLQMQQYKAHIAVESFHGSDVEAIAHVERYERLQVIGGSNRLQLETYDAVVSGVDQMATRAFIQSGWPRLLIDGGTGGFSWRVSTFPTMSEGACVGCLAGNSQRSFNELRAPLRCAGGQADQPVQVFQHFESYGFVSFFGAAFIAARVLQRALGLPIGTGSISVEADSLFLAGMQHKNLQKSKWCLCRCGTTVASQYRAAKYA
jgi:molybdopterin/thiamine biosynthesis adenylyltransferase